MAKLTDTVQVTEKVFQLLRQDMARMVSNRLGATAAEKLRYNREERLDLMAAVESFSTQILADKLVDDEYTAIYHYEVPASWWDMLKLEKAPRWLTNKWPVQYTPKSGTVKVKFERYATYPKANESMRDSHLLVRFGNLEVMKDLAYQTKDSDEKSY